MIIQPVSRREFLDIVLAHQSSRIQNQQEIDFSPGLIDDPEDLQLVWRETPYKTKQQFLPTAILISSDKRQDFLGWVITYLRNFRPFTSYFRVAEPKFAKTILERKEPPSLKGIEDACFGLIIGEAAHYLEGKFDVNQLTPSACERTYSYVMARALSLGILTEENDPITDSWSTARSLTNQPNLKFEIDVLSAPWQVLVSLFYDNKMKNKYFSDKNLKIIADACQSLFETGRIQKKQWNALTKNSPDLRYINEKMDGPREERVVILEHVLYDFTKNMNSKLLSDLFLYAYLTSQVSPGTIDHMKFLYPFTSRFPQVLLWYGLCAGLHRLSSIQDFSIGLGRRVMRDILHEERFLDRPRCDIAIDELEVLAAGSDSLLHFRTGSSGQLKIEIAPCVTTTVRWSTRDGEQEGLFPDRPDPHDTRFLINELNEALERVNHLSGKLGKLYGLPEKEKRPPASGSRKPKNK